MTNQLTLHPISHIEFAVHFDGLCIGTVDLDGGRWIALGNDCQIYGHADGALLAAAMLPRSR